MPSFSTSLERALHQALSAANERHHEYATLEHLLLALLDDTDAAAVMKACNVNVDELRAIFARRDRDGVGPRRAHGSRCSATCS